MRIQVGVDRGRRAATGLQPLAQRLLGRLARVAVAPGRSQEGLAHGLDVVHKGVERARIPGGLAHPQPQFRRKPGSTDLAGTKRDGLQHRGLPGRDHQRRVAGVRQ